MKIEKLTENKIRIIINSEDLDKTNTDIHSLMTKAIETQSLFFEMLSRAEKEVGFYTEGCKLLIEAFSSIDGVLVFTITKTDKKDCKTNDFNNCKKRLVVKRKSIVSSNNIAIYTFDNFEQYCEFCNHIHNIADLDIKKISKNISLYLYNNTYYLIIENINITYKYLNKFYFAISEFGKLSSCSAHFKSKLTEHGETIIKKNAIDIGIKFFAN